MVNIPTKWLDKYWITNHELWQHRFWWNCIIPYCLWKLLRLVDIQHLQATKKNAKRWIKPFFFRLLNCFCHT